MPPEDPFQRLGNAAVATEKEIQELILRFEVVGDDAPADAEPVEEPEPSPKNDEAEE